MKTLTIILAVGVFPFCYSQTLENCSTCSDVKIGSEQLKGLSYDEVKLLKNEIFARNGYVFETERFDEYFSSMDWYDPIGDNDKVVFNETEKENISILAKRERELKQQRSSLIAQLNQLHQIVLSGDSSQLASQFNCKDGSGYGLEIIQETMKKMDPDKIHFYKDNGLIRVSVDDGYKVVVYSITIEGTRILVENNIQSHSRIMEEFGVFSDYRSEMEESYYAWEFEFKDGKLSYVRELAAG